MIWKKSLRAIAAILLVSLSACNLPVGPALGNGLGQDPTSAVQTQVAAIVASTAAAQTNVAILAQSTLAALATNTPEFTFTPSLTPTATFTNTPAAPMVSVSVQTNCRSGPGTAYDALGFLNVGEIAQVVGRNFYSDYWIIKLGSNPVITCWLWGQYATVSGDTSTLPVIAPPPTPTPVNSPTPVGDFTFAYKSFGVGPGYTCLMFDAKSTALTWDSYNFTVHDTTQGITGGTTSNDFVAYDSWCTQTSSATELPPGGIATVMAKLALIASPTGDHFEASLTLCTEDGLAGTCLTHTLNAVFSP